MQNIDGMSSFQKLAAIIERDMDFKEFHQANRKRGVFRLVKSTFEEMVHLLKSFQSKLTPVEGTGLGQILSRGGKSFGYFEYKLFTWISVWLINSHNISSNQIFTAPLQTLQQIFRNKDPLLLRYEFFLVIVLIKRETGGWTLRENRTVYSFIVSHINEKEEKNVNWKLISFRMFEKQFLRTPHQCRERWISHLNPGITKQKWTPKEDLIMLQLYKEYGPKWSLIAKIVTHRNEHMIKNRFKAIQRNRMRRNPESAQFFSVEQVIEEMGEQLIEEGEMMLKDQDFHKIEVRERRGKKYGRRKDSKKRKEVSPDVSQPSPPANTIQSYPQNNLKQSSADHFLQYPCQSQTQTNFTFTCISQSIKESHTYSQSKKFNESDYVWLQNLIQERNRSWIQLQNT